MTTRLKELDYLKCVFIIFMIIFHLVYIGDTYPICKKIVYTFHMSAFLVISGYLANRNKHVKSFIHDMLWIFIPYALLEIGYVFMASLLPIREHIADPSISVYLEKVFVSPIGPYWYLHTLILCSTVYYIIYNVCVGIKDISRLIILGVCLFAMSYVFHLLSFGNAIYFMFGIVVRQSKHSFNQVFQPSMLALLPLVILCLFPENLDRLALGGIAITYLVISFLLFLHTYLPDKIREVCYFIGRNTLAILLFSPVFTIMTKAYLPVFSFDPSGMCFMCVSVIFIISGCLLIVYISDRLHLSSFFFGKRKMLQSFRPNDM